MTKKRRLTDSQVDALASQLDVAREVQSWLLPQKLPRVDGYDFDAAFDPAEDIAGDYYDFVLHRDGLGMCVADASGRGIPAALLMVHTRGILRTVAHAAEDPSDILRKVNERLMEDVRAGTLVTACYAKLIPQRRTLLVASAGHPPMLVVRARSQECLRVSPSGMALGSAAPGVFDLSVSKASVVLEPGDRFVLFTDGAPETRSPEGEAFGMERLVQRAIEYAPMPSTDFTTLMLAALRDHRGTARRTDDTTILTGRLLPNR